MNEIICNRNVVGGCGFRVHDRYFETKTRFTPGVCPNCGGPVLVVEARTDKAVPGLRVNSSNGQVESVPAPAK